MSTPIEDNTTGLEEILRTVNALPNAGGGGGGTEWELIGEITSDGTGGTAGIYLPINFSEYREVYVEAVDIASSELTFRLVLSSAPQWYNGHVLQSLLRTESVMYSALIRIIDGGLKIISGYNSGYSNGAAIAISNTPRNALLVDTYTYVRLDASGKDVPEGCTLKMWGCK